MHVAIPETATEGQQPVTSQMNTFDRIKKILFVARLFKITKIKIVSWGRSQRGRWKRIHRWFDKNTRTGRRRNWWCLGPVHLDSSRIIPAGPCLATCSSNNKNRDCRFPENPDGFSRVINQRHQIFFQPATLIGTALCRIRDMHF
ncbi:MAG: hypothetical protein DYH16_08325 [Nitrosomonas sp. PRO5]|nr:hypothetical protein [Nitrosomonas sp. PRO5]